jgi:hypothetical protein
MVCWESWEDHHEHWAELRSIDLFHNHKTGLYCRTDNSCGACVTWGYEDYREYENTDQILDCLKPGMRKQNDIPGELGLYNKHKLPIFNLYTPFALGSKYTPLPRRVLRKKLKAQ